MTCRSSAIPDEMIDDLDNGSNRTEYWLSILLRREYNYDPPEENSLDATRSRLLFAARNTVGSDDKALFAELRRARDLEHLRALGMPDGMNRTPVDHAGSVHATRAMAWAAAPGLNVGQLEARASSLKSLKCLAFAQLSTADIACVRRLEL